jgi:RES domain-containing protein
VPIVYTSESRALASLEILVHLRFPAALRGFVVFRVDIDEKLIERLHPERLPKRWASDVLPKSLASIGDAWVAAGTSPVLMVPSAVVSGEHNYLLNPRHPLFVKLRIGDSEPFYVDRRLSRQPE